MRINYKPPYLSYALPEQSFRDPWWLLDFEFSTLVLEHSEIIVLMLARMENFELVKEHNILIRPSRNISPGIERLVGITNEALHHAPPPQVAANHLKTLTKQAPLIFWDGGLTLMHLDRLFHTSDSEFDLPHLLLDGLGERLLGDRLDKTPERTLKKLNLPYQNGYLVNLQTLTVRLFQRLEDRGICTTADLLKFTEQDAGYGSL